MFFMLGVQFILMGLLAEINMRTYHESQGKRIYVVRTALNTTESDFYPEDETPSDIRGQVTGQELTAESKIKGS
jgi:hypothetical protein